MIPAFDPDSLSSHGATWLSLLLDFGVKGTAILLTAGLLLALLNRTSAAIRHLVLSLSLASLLLLPALSSVMPEWRISILPATAVAPSTEIAQLNPDVDLEPAESALTADPAAASSFAEVEPVAMPEADLHPSVAAKVGVAQLSDSDSEAFAGSMSWGALAMLMWLVGSVAVLARLLIGLVGVWSLTRRAEPVTDPSWLALANRVSSAIQMDLPVSLLKSDRVTMPLTCGVLKPVVLIPSDTTSWTQDRRGVVLMHEMAHIKRRDCLIQLLANVVCTLYWFNPFVWLAARRLRIERERACDDFVLESGARPSDYADHLLDIARSLGLARCSTFAAVAIAKRSQLEGRLLAILDPSLSRRRPGTASFVAVAVLIASVALPLGALRLTAQASSTDDHVSELATIPELPSINQLNQAPPKLQPKPALPLLEEAQVDAESPAPPEIDTVSPPDEPERLEPPQPPKPAQEAERGRAVEALREALKDTDSQVRLNAMRALSHLHDRSSIDALKGLITDKDPTVRAQAAWGLGLNGDASAVSLLITALRDENARVRSQAAWALGLKGDASAVDPLIAALKDSDDHVRSQAAWALGLKGQRRAGEALAAALKDSSANVRSQAAWALGLQADYRFADALSAAMKDESQQVRKQAAWALGMILIRSGDGGVERERDSESDKEVQVDVRMRRMRSTVRADLKVSRVAPVRITTTQVGPLSQTTTTVTRAGKTMVRVKPLVRTTKVRPARLKLRPDIGIKAPVKPDPNKQQ